MADHLLVIHARVADARVETLRPLIEAAFYEVGIEIAQAEEGGRPAAEIR